MARVYLETSFMSACVTTRADPASIYRRDTSLDWWQTQAPRHELFISAEVIAELSHPNFPSGPEALELVRDVPLLDIDAEVSGFADILVRERVMPAPVAGDAIHVAVACVHGVDYLISWNVRHLANPNKITHLRTICVRAGSCRRESSRRNFSGRRPMPQTTNKQTQTPPRPDPLIDEVRAVRKLVSDQSGNDVTRLSERLQEIQRQHQGRVVRKPPPQGDNKVA